MSIKLPRIDSLTLLRRLVCRKGYRRRTTRRAAPRADYLAMLERRLKRREGRVVRTIPKEEMAQASAIPKAILKQATGNQPHWGRRRGADEELGNPVDKWAVLKSPPPPLKWSKLEENKANIERLEHPPSERIQWHPLIKGFL